MTEEPEMKMRGELRESLDQLIMGLIPQNLLDSLQEDVDHQMLTNPQWRDYARQGKLGLIDSRMAYVDELIKYGYIRVDRIRGM